MFKLIDFTFPVGLQLGWTSKRHPERNRLYTWRKEVTLTFPLPSRLAARLVETTPETVPAEWVEWVRIGDTSALPAAA